MDKNSLSVNKEISSSVLSNENYDYYYDDDYLEDNVDDKIVVDHNTFIKEDEILKEREKVISEAMEKLFLNREQAILAMIYYQWNLDKLDTWYEDVDKNKVLVGLELSPAKKKELLDKGVEENGENCLICFEDKNDNFFALDCGHEFCKDCWKGYLEEKLKSPLSALQATCPQEGCTCIVYENLFKKFLKDKNLLEKLDKAIFKNFINRNEDIKQCPNQHCHYYVKSNMHSSREINCICGTSYCFKCSRESHRPCTCEMVEKWDKRSKNDTSDEKWIRANTKECPHCHQKIEKSQGCNYMLCDKRAGGCGHAFCYVCETDWAKHSQDHFNCNKYTEAVKNKEKMANKLKEELKRYDFYFTRYMNYKKDAEYCDKKDRVKLGEKRQYLTTVRNLPIIETEFIIEALNTLVKAKNTLKYTYIFGYYMKDNNKKDYFELKQGFLESNQEKLYKYLLVDKVLDEILDTDIYYEFTKGFQQYKNYVNNMILIINKYNKDLNDEIENSFINEINNELLDEKV